MHYCMDVLIFGPDSAAEGGDITYNAHMGPISLSLLSWKKTGYIAKAGDFKAKGVDEIVVLSVNDCFVMRAWEKTFDTDKARYLPTLDQLPWHTQDHMHVLGGARPPQINRTRR